MLKTRSSPWLLPLLLLSFLLRLGFSVYYFNAHPVDYYWEYGDIARNLLHGRGYSLFYLLNDKPDLYFNPHARPLPSAYVPPAYVFYLLPFLNIKSILLRNLLITGIQHLFSTLNTFLLYRLCTQLFSARVAFIAACLYAFLPEFIFSSSSFGPITFYHTVLLLLFIQLGRTAEQTYPLWSSSLLFATGIYLRSEMALFVILWFIYLFYCKSYRAPLLSGLIIFFLLLPWQVRNYRVFNAYIPFSSSSGINFYRGHNADGIGEWGWAKVVYGHKDYLFSDDHFELRFKNLYMQEGIKYLQEHPMQEFKNIFIKTFHLWVLNPGDERARHPLYIIPWLLLLPLILYGLYAAHKSSANILYLFILSSTLVCILFFALPRYQSIMKIALLPFAAFSIEKISGRLPLLKPEAK